MDEHCGTQIYQIQQIHWIYYWIYQILVGCFVSFYFIYQSGQNHSIFRSIKFCYMYQIYQQNWFINALQNNKINKLTTNPMKSKNKSIITCIKTIKFIKICGIKSVIFWQIEQIVKIMKSMNSMVLQDDIHFSISQKRNSIYTNTQKNTKQSQSNFTCLIFPLPFIHSYCFSSLAGNSFLIGRCHLDTYQFIFWGGHQSSFQECDRNAQIHHGCRKASSTRSWKLKIPVNHSQRVSGRIW